ncbi:MAG: hypothetical protein KatS3mg002_0911 [Candidatus Woesearchaeota archaeon]|nr:MAG: hypothetical protein KatS3mg002_0911 [Candidatus Woesearchaeota archaeon]
MNDYEKMRKMNELAKDLKRHGFAESSFEAIQQASQIYGEDSITHEVRHGLIKDNKGDNLGDNKMNDQEADKKIRKIQDNVDILTNKMNEIIQAINDLDSRLVRLTKEVQKIEPRSSNFVREEQQKVLEKSSQEHSVNQDQKSDEYANQRVGNYHSEDVAIDKMFYFGKK